MKQSIRTKLSLFLSAAIFVVAAIAGSFSFLSALNEAHELQDDTLRQVGALFAQAPTAPVGTQENKIAKDADEDSRVFVQFLDRGRRWSANGTAKGVLPIPATLPDGLHSLILAQGSFRVFLRTMASGERVAVAQETALRDETARDSAFRTLMPFVILVPILLLIVANLVHQMFRPLVTLAREIDRRGEHELHAVKKKEVPVEVEPFLLAINRLLDRVARSMEVQRQFVADAAHELRSPLTALSLQAERLSQAEMSSQAHERLATLRRGIERGRRLLDQLLTLAKVRSSRETPEPAVSVLAVFRRVLEDLMPLAEQKQIDIGMEGGRDAHLQINELDLAILIKNLVENAIRYTPNGGKVDFSVITSGGQTILEVRDTGPGMPVGERERVFDPFYRVPGSDGLGSGLGLSIVRAIADRIGADIRLRHANDDTESGLVVSVVLPAVQL